VWWPTPPRRPPSRISRSGLRCTWLNNTVPISESTRWLPGFFLTAQNEYLLIDQQTNEPTQRGRTILAHTPANRYGDPDDLLGALLWLVSDAAAFVSGTVIPVDGASVPSAVCSWTAPFGLIDPRTPQWHRPNPGTAFNALGNGMIRHRLFERAAGSEHLANGARMGSQLAMHGAEAVPVRKRRQDRMACRNHHSGSGQIGKSAESIERRKSRQALVESVINDTVLRRADDCFSAPWARSTNAVCRQRRSTTHVRCMPVAASPSRAPESPRTP